MLVAPLAIAQDDGGGAPDATAAGNARGEPVEIQVRNRSRGETGLVTSSDDYSLRLSNTQQNGGGGAVYGCRAPSSPPAANRACLYADNLRQGEAFLFRSRNGTKVGHFDLGNTTGPPFSTNATGRVENLNADRLDNLHASEIISQGRAADTLDGIDSTGFLRNPVRRVLSTESNVPDNTSDTQAVSCPAGEKAIAGGAAWVLSGTGTISLNDGADIHATRPTPPTEGADSATGWEAGGRNDTGGARDLQVWALCVPA